MDKNNQVGANMAFNVNSKPFVPQAPSGLNKVRERKGKQKV